MGKLTFNGISSDDLGLIVQFKPSYTYPSKEYDTLHIPGKNGDLILDKGSYQNVEKTYSLAKVFKPGEDFIESANAIVSWLQSAKGYARLEDSYEPDYYRLAMYESDGSLSNFYDTATVIDVSFKCKPQRWLISGEKDVSITSGKSLKNPTNFDSLPIIKFTNVANSVTTITIGSTTLQFASIPESLNVTVDCENMECYSEDKLLNSKLILTDGKFPVLNANSKTVITFENASNVKIQPRWWTL